MYLDFYGFREKPFNLTPDPRFVFLSKNRREAFAHLLYAIDNRTGFIALTGEVGLGKTTVLRSLLCQLDPNHYRTALIFNPCLSPHELLQNINREFGISANSSNIGDLLYALNMFLLRQNAEGHTVVLVIDEVQNLERQVLEQIRLISNLETDKEKLIQIVLSGQPEFEEILNKKNMRQLNQRITVRYHLTPMNFEDTVHYIDHRLEVAGGRGGVIFSRAALKKIHSYSRGIPRLINTACDRALLAGYTRDTARIGYRIAAAGISDMKKNVPAYARKRHLILIPALAMIVALSMVGIFYSWDDFASRFNVSQNIGAVENQKKEPADATGEGFFRAMAVELGNVPESESNRRAFNKLAVCWNVPPVPESIYFDDFNKMEIAAHDRGLRVYSFSGSLGSLLRINCPAVLELTLPGITGKRFISLVRMENGQFLVDPQISGTKFLSPGEIEKHWSGQGYLLWKDHLNLLMRMPPGKKGEQIKRLQRLLEEAGAYSGPFTGAYDGNTLSAVKNFQSFQGIEQDGILSAQTLILLYRSSTHFEAPRLDTAGQK
ncbi:MAG TPA: AAA family ATPase [Syntrophales bacterium]|nr:AAA family ATPase [Syntrophales bacterium]